MNIESPVNQRAIMHASDNGHVHLLEQWLQDYRRRELAFPKPYSRQDMGTVVDVASANGHVDTIQWWFDRSREEENGIVFEYTNYAMHEASRRGHIHVLDWWIRQHTKSGITLYYTYDVILDAMASGRTDVLDWWLTHIGHEFVRSSWMKSPVIIHYTTFARYSDYAEEHMRVLQWYNVNIRPLCGKL